MRRLAGRAAATAAAMLVVFVLGLVLAEAVPDDVVVDRLLDATASGDLGRLGADDGIGGAHDGFTECVALGHGLGTPPEPMGLLGRALWAPRIGSCTEQARQLPALDAGETVAAGAYFRYWNGYAPVVRPVVATIGVVGLRVVSGLLLLAGLALAAVTTTRRLGLPVTAALLGPVVASTNLAVTPWGSLTHALSWAAIGAGTAAVAVATDRGSWVHPALAAAAGAALFVHVDLLTTPAVPWALAVFVAGAARVRGGADPTTALRPMVAVAIAWPVAWAGTWAARWVVAALVHGGEVFAQVREISSFRVSGAADGVQDGVGVATRVNLRWWLDHATPSTAVLALSVLLAAGALALAVRRTGAVATATRVGLLAAPALVVPAWYEALSNHSQIHAFFTYRSLAVALGIGLAACIAAALPVRPAAAA